MKNKKLLLLRTLANEDIWLKVAMRTVFAIKGVDLYKGTLHIK